MSSRLCVLQCVAVCCSVLQCVAVCCSGLQRVAACCSVLQRVAALQCESLCDLDHYVTSNLYLEVLIKKGRQRVCVGIRECVNSRARHGARAPYDMHRNLKINYQSHFSREREISLWRYICIYIYI